MDLSFLLLTIISRLDGERSIYASYHLLRGKRSGQTLQDVEYYSLKGFFCILPRLKIDVFDGAINHLKKAGYISIDEDSVVYITKKGKEVLHTLPLYRFNGWDYRGREHVFFSRLSLIVQTASYFRADQKSFMPMQNDYDIQLFVKEFLLKQRILDEEFSNQLFQELRNSIEQSGMNGCQKTIFVHRLGGYKHAGWTWKQLSDEMGIKPFTLSLYYIESLHMLLQTISQSSKYPLLTEIIKNIQVSTYLTESTIKTKELFNQGMSMQKISQLRHLKMSTIEDHFVEISINDQSFPIEEFVSATEIAAVVAKSSELGTKRLRLLKEEFPSLTYFQLRLILGTGSRGGAKWISNQSC
ncbi:helix-turn-helix domain-containing protein [Sporosarcina jiandibaonis]|uniref:helix-turn-helix domain-containing protein n=1 Tax=Sporosarcina jiandibaonis TaxID=2715535 RepID=UPI00155405D3|nr:helix-turn-helix domain-containing protein [Sporosarcina jiandibaonis]